MMLLDHHEDYDSNQVRHHDEPTGRRDVQEITERTIPATKRIEVACQHQKDASTTKHDKP